MNRVRVWDLPTRVFHWVLVASLIGSVITGTVGGNALVWHFRLGYLALALLVFRVLWGFVGGYWSRFVNFIYPPSAIVAYLRGDAGPGGRYDVGHSPLGALSVFAMLALLIAQVATGLFADDEIASTGPLNRFVSSATASALTSWHKGWGKSLLITLIVLHIAAIVYYRIARRRKLVKPMVTGDKLLPAGTPASADGPRQRVLALVLFAIGLGLAAWVSSFAF